MPKGYLIAHVSVTDPEAYRHYVAQVPAIIAAHGGRYLVRGGRAEALESEAKERHVVLEFPDYAAAERFYRSPEYSEAMKIRHAAAVSDVVIVEGYDA